MKKSDFLRQCFGGLKKGMTFQVMGGPHDGKIFEITKSTNVKDVDGFNGIEVTFQDGQIEVCAIQIMMDAIDGLYEHNLKMI